MKRLILFLFLIFIFQRIYADSASSTDALNIAEYFINLNEKPHTIPPNSITVLENDEQIDVAYIVNLLPQGFIAISNDTDIRPIIAFSFLNDFIYTEDINNTLLDLLKTDMTNRLLALSLGELPFVQENNDLWLGYLNHTLGSRIFQQWPSEETSTGGWIETTWHQLAPYNNFCPQSTQTLTRYYAGCVAIALAQVLNYNEFIGNRYWTNENDGYTSNGTETIVIDDAAETFLFPYFESNLPIIPNFYSLNYYHKLIRVKYNCHLQLTETDIAALCYISGVSTHTVYRPPGGPLGSGSSPTLIDLVNKFDYDYAELIISDSKYVVIPELIIDMKNAQPVIFSITGHQVICDGYRIDDDHEKFFHLNFGWGESNPGGGYNPTEAWYDIYGDLPGSYEIGAPHIAHICPPGKNGYVSGNVELAGGTGHVTDVTITVGYKEVHPDVNGDFEVEIFNGNHDVKTNLYEYEDSIIENITVVANETTDNVNFVLEPNIPTYIYVPNDQQTIQDGINAAENGDMVIVSPGEYFEDINFQGKRIKVVSLYYFNNDESYINNTIINGNMLRRVVYFNSGEDFNASLEGFTITGGFMDPEMGFSHGAGISCRNSSPILKDLIITGNEAENSAAVSLHNSDAILQNIRVFNNTNLNSTSTANGAIGCTQHHDTSDPIFENVSIYNNNNEGISVQSQSTVVLNNVTIFNNGGFGLYSNMGYVMMNNCLVWENNEDSIDQIGYYNGSVSINYSDIQGGWTGNGYYNIDILPQICETTLQPEWTPTVFSPLIDAGDPLILDPDGTPSDIGAVRAIDHKIDSIELIEMTEGINWKCLPIIDTVFADYDIASYIFSEIQQTPFPALNLIEFQDGVNIYYDVNEWQNNTRLFTSDLGCKIHMNDSYTLQLTGFLEYPHHVINLELGDNWIGYYLEDSMKPLDAFEAILDDIDMIQTKTFTLNKTALGWLGAANWTINYGDLVVVHCTNNSSFYWGEDGGGTIEKSSRSSSQDFEYTEEADYLPVYVELDNQALGNPTEIGLFINGECKGAEVITDSLVQLRAYVMNDTTVFDPVDMELQLSYGSRSLNTTITDFKVKHDILDEWESNDKYKAQGLQNYYLISLTDSENDTPVVNRTTLSQNYPNPFNPTTTINYSIAEEGIVELTVYNIKGQKVKTLVNEIKEAGQHSIVWNGKDNTNKTISSGIYFYRLSTGKRNMKKKMLLLK